MSDGREIAAGGKTSLRISFRGETLSRRKDLRSVGVSREGKETGFANKPRAILRRRRSGHVRCVLVNERGVLSGRLLRGGTTVQGSGRVNSGSLQPGSGIAGASGVHPSYPRCSQWESEPFPLPLPGIFVPSRREKVQLHETLAKIAQTGPDPGGCTFLPGRASVRRGDRERCWIGREPFSPVREEPLSKPEVAGCYITPRAAPKTHSND